MPQIEIRVFYLIQSTETLQWVLVGDCLEIVRFVKNSNKVNDFYSVMSKCVDVTTSLPGHRMFIHAHHD
jgi:hypothetical protein